MGTLIDSGHCEKVAGYIDRGLSQGAALFLDGRDHPQGDHAGYPGRPSSPSEQRHERGAR